MLPETRENIQDYGIIACLITILSLWIRPYVNIWQTVKEMAITFIVSMCAGLIFVGLDIPQPVRFGCAGIIGLLAVRIYNILDVLLRTVEKDPVSFYHEHVHKKKQDDK